MAAGRSVAGAVLVAGTLLAGPAAALTFDDVAPQAGLDFVHVGDGSDSNFAEFMGAGACWADFDGDGYDDLFLTNTRFSTPAWNDLFGPRSALYRNEGDGTFTDVTEGSGTGLSLWGQGCSAADYDGDADPDLLQVSHGLVVLLRNDGDFRFTNVTQQAGVGSEQACAPDPCFGIHGAWQDYDRDGDLDLYVINYIGWEFGEIGDGPDVADGQPNVLYRNEGDGSFTDVTQAANADGDPGPDRNKALGVSWFDWDRDGLADLYIASDSVANALLRNNGDGTFADVTAAAAADDTRASMGLDAGWANDDGLPDLYYTHYEDEHNGFLLNTPAGRFEDHSGEGDLAADYDFVGWGTAFADFDNDGDADLMAVNGHTPPYEPPFRVGPQRTLFWLNDGLGHYTDASTSSGGGLATARVSRGLALADYDWDGDLDALVANLDNETPQLLANSGAAGNWLLLDLRAAGTNTHAVGAEVTATTSLGAVVRERVEAGSSYQSQHSTTVHLGLGAATGLASLEVRWPTGAVQTFTDLAAGQLLRLTEGSAAVLDDTLSPRTAALLEGLEGENGWFRGPVTVTLSAQDRGVTRLSGLDRIERHLDSSPWQPYDGPFTVGPGRHVAEYRAWDREGNRESLRAARVDVDAQPPATSLFLSGTPGQAGWYHSPVTVALEASDALSGVAVTELRLDEGPWSPYLVPFKLAAPGPHRLEYRSRDVAGNVEPSRSRDVGVDLAPPATSLSVTGPQARDAIYLYVTGESRLVLDAADDGSGVERTELRLDGGPWTAYAGPFGLEGADGPRRLEFRSLDVSGRGEDTRSARLWLDNAHGPPIDLRSPRRDALHAWSHTAPLDPLATGLLGRVPWPFLTTASPQGLTVLVGHVPVDARAGPDPSGVGGLLVTWDGERAADSATDRVAFTLDVSADRAGWHRLGVESWDLVGNRDALDFWLYTLPSSRAGLEATAEHPPSEDVPHPVP